MGGVIYFRDPRNPGDVFGPVPLDQVRQSVEQGRVRAGDQVSFDKHSWMPASELEPGLFPGSQADWLAGQPQWKQTAHQALEWCRAAAIAAWDFVKRAFDFYWSQRKELREMATEYLTFLKEPGTRREIRVTADEQHAAVKFENDQWQVEMPDCCVVCGEPANFDWSREQRSIPDLTWPFLSPILGLLAGIVCWILDSDSHGRWFIPLGLFVGFLIGYRVRRERIVTIRFRRCREHLNKTRIPSLRIFRRTLIIGVGDRKVWRKFYHGERDVETPLSVPPEFSQAIRSVESSPTDPNPGPSYPTIKLVDDSEMEPREGSGPPV